MRIPRLFAPQDLTVNVDIALTGAKAHYLRNVLRCRLGQDIIVFNGDGREYAGVIQALNRDSALIAINAFAQTDRESALVIKLGLSIIKGDAMDSAIQKATELGVSEVTPLVTSHTTIARKSLQKREDHWRKVIESSCEQCERNRLPKLNGVRPMADWTESVPADLKLLAHPGVDNRFSDITDTPASVALLSGPEGGFSAAEVLLATAAGFQSINLGPRILRADTTPLALLSLIQSRWGDL